LAAELVSGRVLGAPRRAKKNKARAAGAAERLAGRVFLSTREADLGFGHERTSFECKRLHSRLMTAIAPTIDGVTTLEYESLPAVASEETAVRAGTVVMKFGGTSVGDVDRL